LSAGPAFLAEGLALLAGLDLAGAPVLAGWAALAEALPALALGCFGCVMARSRRPLAAR
jgi:hypothetical protein